MLISRFDLGANAKPRFAWWRMLVWVLLLLAAFGGTQYIRHAQQVWTALQTLSGGDAQSGAALRGMLAWDLAYLIAALAVIVACAGCILRQTWARPVLRVFALLLCVWTAYQGMLLFHQWQLLGQAGAALQADVQWLHLRRIVAITLALKAVAVPVLLWLAWQLGQPSVRLQFRARSR